MVVDILEWNVIGPPARLACRLSPTEVCLPVIMHNKRLESAYLDYLSVGL